MYEIGVEPWSEAFWNECRALAEAHFEEVDGGVEPRRPFKLDLRLMQALSDAGAMLIIAGRREGRLVSYFTWQVTLDVESEGLLVAMQGAWYVAPGHFRLADRTFDAGISALKKLGVQCVFPHHRAQGRGSHLGRFFTRKGATKIQETYLLWIGT